MTVNQFFNSPGSGYIGEQDLLRDLTIECIQIHGHDMYYIPRTLNKEDYLFGEDVLSSFESSYMIEMYIENVEGYGGDGDFLSKFGLEVRDSATFVMSRHRFEEEIDQDVRTTPKEGDLVYIPLTDSLFEITHVEHENPFYQHDKLNVYKLKCELFQYSQETMDTGVEAVDDIQIDLENLADTSNDVFANNDEIGEETDDLIQWTETNPFGTPRDE